MPNRPTPNPPDEILVLLGYDGIVYITACSLATALYRDPNVVLPEDLYGCSTPDCLCASDEEAFPVRLAPVQVAQAYRDLIASMAEGPRV